MLLVHFDLSPFGWGAFGFSPSPLLCISSQFIDQFEENMPVLRAEVEELQAQTREPREVVFEDVLLRRPKCTPDMDVVLNIPVEEPLPF